MLSPGQLLPQHCLISLIRTSLPLRLWALADVLAQRQGLTCVGWLGTVLTMVSDCATMLKVGACRLEFRPPVMRAKE